MGDAVNRRASLLCGGTLFLRFAYDSTLATPGDSTGHLLHDVRVESFQLLAWLIGLALLARLPRTRITGYMLSVLPAVALLGLVDVSAGLAGFAVLLYWPGENSLARRRAGAVFAAILTQSVLAPALFELCAPYVVRFDTLLVGPLVAWTVPGAKWAVDTITIPNGHSVQITNWCSSFHNVSLAALAWVALTRLERPDWQRGDLLVLLAVSGLQILLNTLRIYLMALSYDMYLYWHEGLGARIFSVTASVLTILICVHGARLAAGDGGRNKRMAAAGSPSPR